MDPLFALALLTAPPHVRSIESMRNHLIGRCEFILGGRRPPEELSGRCATDNGFGFCDARLNETSLGFLKFAFRNAVPPRDSVPAAYALEVGGGVGYLAAHAVRNGVPYLFNDRSETQCRAAETRLQAVARHPDQVEVFPGEFPGGLNPQQRQRLREKRIVAVGAFMVLHFMKGAQIEAFFDSVYELLSPGGRVFVTAATPYNGYLLNFQREYYRRLRLPTDDPQARYPGEIDDAHRYLPQARYPGLLHVLEPWVLERAAQGSGSKARFRVVQSAGIPRPEPADQAWRGGYGDGRTELIGMVFEKL